MSTAAKYKQHPKYKASGIEWIREIPSSWECKKIKYVSKMDDGGSWGADEGLMELNSKVATTAHITMDGKWIVDKMPERSFSRSEYERYSVKQGDIVVVKSSGSADNIISGKAGYVDKDVEGIVFSNFLLRIATDKEAFSSRYLYYFLISDLTRQRIERMVSATTYPNLKIREYFSSFIPFPTLEQQKCIAAFLDKTTRQTDVVLTKKQKLIELLKEKRQALITQAVTKGLDPTAKLKLSGIEWLGDIPEGWGVKRLRFLCSGQFEYGANEEASDDNPENTRYIRITDIREDGELHADTFRSLPDDIAAPYMLQEGDILFARSGATVGKTFRYKSSWGRCCYAGYLIRMRVDSRKVNSGFLYYYTLSDAYRQWKDSIFWQATIQNISAEKYKNFTIALPGLTEQSRIVEYLDAQTASIDEVTKRVTSQIERLREYRQALITAAVTGKIMVE